DFAARLAAVHRSLYLFFNEGYHGASAVSAVRRELCYEAMRLTALLLEHPLTSRPATYALAALMSLHAARLPARVDASGHLLALFDQDRAQWDHALVSDGLQLLDTTWKLLQSEAAHVRLLSWHQHVQDVRTRVALSQQLLDE